MSERSRVEDVDSPNEFDTAPVTALDTSEIQPVRARSGLGCWITGLFTLVTVAALVAIGLLLPPFNLLDRMLGTQYVMFGDSSYAAAADGLTVQADPADFGVDFGVALARTTMSQFFAADTSAGDWVAEAFAAQPPNLALQSDIYTIETMGSAPERLTIQLDLPATLVSADVLDLYAWDSERAIWEFIPAHESTNGTLVAFVDSIPEHVALFQAAPVDQPRVVAAVDVTQMLTASAAELATIIAPAGLQPTTEGTLAGSLAPGFELNAGYLVMPVIRNFLDFRAIDPDTVVTILNSRTLRSQHAAQIAAFASSGYDGVIIDYRELPVEARENFSAFITELGRLTDQSGAQLGVVVPAASVEAGAWWTGAYDWRAIGAAADFVQINMPNDPLAYTEGEDRLVEAMLRYAVGEIERGKILMGLSVQSVRQDGETFTPISFDQALSALGDVTIDADMSNTGTVDPGTLITASLDGYRAATGNDPATGQQFIDYLDTNNSTVARMWLMTPDALRYRTDRGARFMIGGAAFEDLLAPGIADGIYEAIQQYKLGVPVQQGPRELALRWTISGADGGTLGEVFTGLNDSLFATIVAPDGNYAINVDIVSGDGAASDRGGAAVAVFEPTATPTPLPTATPTPTPAPTNTPNRAAAVTNPTGGSSGGGGGGAAVAPGAGSIAAGNFEYGGHVTGTGTGGVAAMQRAGMNWMKIQLRYSPGMGADAAAAPIAEAHGRGFKILIGIVGYPNDLAAGGGGYVQQFAAFTGAVASLGPDAIEVWNEPNIDREWPNGQISGAAYAEMLRQAYQAIKGANGGVMVISAAPAPTGAEAAYPGAVVNDDNFIRDMVAAGAVQWMDCLGAHYNEGIVSPSQMSGDPRDNYYTRYFLGMLNTYWGLVGGQRPICFTELGYLTPEGYPPLDPYFGWAANVTVSQQAAWLAEAAALASQSGKVRLMIVWNIDFTFYGADPMAGFAIIRPGGGCPACDALAGAR